MKPPEDYLKFQKNNLWDFRTKVVKDEICVLGKDKLVLSYRYTRYFNEGYEYSERYQ